MAETGEVLSSNRLITCGLSHRKRKALWKREKRKLQRQTAAQERDKQLEIENEIKKNSPNYAQRLVREEEQERAELLQIEAESRRQHELWEWHEEMYKQKLREKEEQAEKERQHKLEIEKKIKEEWEERQKKEKEEEEEKKKKKEKQVIRLERWTWMRNIQQPGNLRLKTEELLKQAREAENKDGDWSNPLAPVQYGKERQVETCPFFAKVAACRFGDRCSRAHPYPESSRTLLFTCMFRHFQLDQGLCEEYDTDIVLEYEDSEVYQKFKEFYEDVLPEFKAIGNVVQFKVCCNFQPHLRGNVYVSYSREEDAVEAYTKFNARWYGGKQISAQFVVIPSWRRAICGLFGKGRCPKGRECNFLHVFKNPSGEFNMADRDMEPFTPRQNYKHRNRRSRSRDRHYSPSRSSRKYKYSRSRSRSAERHSSRYSRHRSRSGERHRSYRSRKRSRSPKYKSSSSRQRSRSSSRRSRSYRSKVSKNRKKSRSESDESERSSRENTPVYNKASKNEDNYVEVSTSFEATGIKDQPMDELIWVEKTIDDVNKNSKRQYRSHCSVEESESDKDEQKRSDSSGGDSDYSGLKKHKKKSKKRKRSKDK